MDTLYEFFFQIHASAFKYSLLWCFMLGSYLAFPFGVLCVWWLIKSLKKKLFGTFFQWVWRLVLVFFVMLTGVFVWARFYERYDLRANEHTVTLPGVSQKTIVVMADPHLGVLKGRSWMQTVVDEINAQNPDLVLIPGDFTFAPREQDLPDLLTPLSDITVPIYAVLGNHDLPSDRDVSTQSIASALIDNGVILIDEKTVRHTFDDGETCWLIGPGDSWNYPFNRSLWAQVTARDCSIAVTHSPDRAVDIFDAQLPVSLVLAGHTHGGQVWFSFLDMKKIIPSNYPFVDGWYGITRTVAGAIEVAQQEKYSSGSLLITVGVGETLLPLRFGVPPAIEILNIE